MPDASQFKTIHEIVKAAKNILNQTYQPVVIPDVFSAFPLVNIPVGEY